MAQRPAHRRRQDGDSSPDRQSHDVAVGPNGDDGGVVPPGAANGLTAMPQGIHWAAAAEGGEGPSQGQDENELDDIAVNHFLDTLTQVALSIASRKLSKERGEQTC